MPSASPRFLRFLTGPVEAGCVLGAELLAGDAVAVVELGSGCALWFACRTASDWNEGPPAMPRVGSATDSELSFVRASLEDRPCCCLGWVDSVFFESLSLDDSCRK